MRRRGCKPSRPPGRARSRARVVRGKMGYGITAVSAALYPAWMAVLFSDAIWRLLDLAFDGGPWWSWPFALSGPATVLGLYSLWRFSGRGELSAAHDRAVEAIAPSAVEYH